MTTGRRRPAGLPLRFLGASFLALVVVACGTPPAPPPPAPVPAPPPPAPTRETAMVLPASPRVPELVDPGDWASLAAALERNVRWLAGRPGDQVFVYGPRTVTAAQLLGAQRRLLAVLAGSPLPSALAEAMAADFEVLEAAGGEDGGMLVTGYFEALIDGCLRPGPGCAVPVYAPPSGTVTVELGDFDPALAGRKLLGRLDGRRLVPLPDRREIRSAAPYRGREIAWARDPVDLFFLEVQGSGALRLEGGGELRIGYAGSNGRTYRSIGRLLIDEGHLEREEVSMQSIRGWLAAHPDELERVLDHNESFVFFRRLDGPPVGNLGFPVTPLRSVAVDQSLLPPAALAFLLTSLPAAPGAAARRPVRRFVLTQDSGGAIRGPGRVDLFWGRGEEAAASAGVMKEAGRLFFLVPRAASAPAVTAPTR